MTKISNIALAGRYDCIYFCVRSWLMFNKHWSESKSLESKYSLS